MSVIVWIILQLADYMLVLGEGRVIAQGALTEVWNSEQMRPWLPAKDLSSLICAHQRASSRLSYDTAITG